MLSLPGCWGSFLIDDGGASFLTGDARLIGRVEMVIFVPELKQCNLGAGSGLGSFFVVRNYTK